MGEFVAGFLVGLGVTLFALVTLFDATSSVSQNEFLEATEMCGNAGLHSVTPNIRIIKVKCIRANLKGTMSHHVTTTAHRIPHLIPSKEK